METEAPNGGGRVTERRAHWRNQRCGPGLSEVRRIRVRGGTVHVGLQPSGAADQIDMWSETARPAPAHRSRPTPDGPEPIEVSARVPGGRMRRAHWRRQPCGPGGSLRRLTLIDETPLRAPHAAASRR